MYRLPPLNPLRAFEAAARHRSFTKAANELFVTQGAISRQVKKLEGYLDAQLFYRDANNVKLTPVAIAILPAISLAFENISQAIEVINSAKSVIRLQVSPSFATRWLLPRIGKFMQENENISVRASITLHPETFDALSFDAAAIYGDGQWPDLHAVLISEEILQPVCAPSLLEKHGPIEKIEDLDKHVLIHNSTDRRDWPIWLHHVQASVHDSYDGPAFETMDMAVRAAEDGMGVVVGDLSLISESLKEGSLVKLFHESCSTGRGIFFVCPRESKKQKSMSKFEKWLVDNSPIKHKE